MIEINLLPEELKAKSRVKPAGQLSAAKASALDKDKFFVYAIPAVLVILLCVHLGIGVAAISKNSRLFALNREWIKLAPEKKMLEEFNREYYDSSQGVGTLEQMNAKKIHWAMKLNSLSRDLPAGVWFSDLSAGSKGLVIRGSVVSLRKEEVGLINKFIDSLRSDSDFFGDFTSLELSSVQERSIGGFDIADFILTGEMKSK